MNGGHAAFGRAARVVELKVAPTDRKVKPIEVALVVHKSDQTPDKELTC